jgi:hypothetical protein
MGTKGCHQTHRPRKRTPMKKVNLLLSLLFVFLAHGCGYTTHAYVAQTGYKTIYVKPFLNKVNTTSEYSEGSRFQTYFPLLENTITNAVVNRFIFDGNLKVVKEMDSDLVLKGELTSYSRDTLRNVPGTDTPEEYRVTIFVNLTLSNNKTKNVVWEKDGFAGDTTYFTTGNLVKSEPQALQDATDDLARRIVEATVEAW